MSELPVRFGLRLGLIAALSALTVIPFLGCSTVWHVDEGRFSQISREMAQSGDWIVPRIGGEPYPCYPPLTFWFMAASGSAFGFNEFAMRLPSALAGVALVVVVGLMGRRLAGEGAGLASALVLATVPAFVVQQAAARADVLLALFATIAFDCFLAVAEGDRRRRTAAMIHLSVVLGILAKGPLAIVIPGLGVAAWLALNRRWSVLKELRLVAGIPAVLLAVAPWYVAAYRAEGAGFLKANLLLENLDAFATGNEHPRPFWSYLAWAPPRLGPWLPFLALALIGRRRAWPGIGLAWLAAVALFLTISSAKRPNYLTYLYPAFALAAGIVIASSWKEAPDRVLQLLEAVAAVVAITGAVVWLVPIPWKGDLVHVAPYAPAIGAASFTGAAILIAVTLYKGAVAGTATLALLTAGGMAAHLAVLAPRLESEGRAGAEFCRRAAAAMPAGERIATVGPERTEGSFHFYVGYPLPRRAGEPGHYLLNQEQLERLARSGRRIETLDSVPDDRGRLNHFVRVLP